jgi:calcium-dependent protein kinase
MAPEIVQRQNYGTAVDIWATGVLLHIMVVGCPPFVTIDKKELFEQLKTQPVILKDADWENVTKNCKEIVQLMLKRDPKERPTAAQLL